MSFVLRKIESIYRLSLLSFPKDNIFANALINEYPKSGGTWLAHMISELSKVPFPENEFPKKFPALFHGHYKASFKHIPTVILWRDPRDIMVSWYYHRLIPNPHTSSAAVEKTRAQLNFNDYDDISSNLAPFIDYCFTVKSFPRFSWSDFYDKWFDKDQINITHTSYELLSTQTAIELKKIMIFLSINASEEKIEEIIEKNSFESKAKRPAGIENNNDFLRKGIVGDWKNVFNDEAYQVLKQHTGHRLDKYQERFIKQ